MQLIIHLHRARRKRTKYREKERIDRGNDGSKLWRCLCTKTCFIALCIVSHSTVTKETTATVVAVEDEEKRERERWRAREGEENRERGVCFVHVRMCVSVYKRASMSLLFHNRHKCWSEALSLTRLNEFMRYYTKGWEQTREKRKRRGEEGGEEEELSECHERRTNRRLNGFRFRHATTRTMIQNNFSLFGRIGFSTNLSVQATRDISLVPLILFTLVHSRNHIHRTGTDCKRALRTSTEKWRVICRCLTFCVIRMCPRSTRFRSIRTCPAFGSFDWNPI